MAEMYYLHSIPALDWTLVSDSAQILIQHLDFGHLKHIKHIQYFEPIWAQAKAQVVCGPQQASVWCLVFQF